MVGDGINDVLVLVKVNVGIVMGIGIDVVINSVYVMLVKGDLWVIVCVIELLVEIVSNMC